MTLESFLNEPLKAKVDLLNTGDLDEDQIKVRLATTEDFDRLGVDRAYFLTGIKFEIQVDDSGRGHILLTSDDPVLEPYLDFIIETRWPSGRLLREYTVLVDPPAFDQAAQVISASERVETLEGIAAPTKKKTEAAAGSGTRVDLGQQSGLAPGEMPQRSFSSDAAQRPASGSRYMIRRDENLWSIARDAAPEGASIHQTMLDIQRLNPDAFIDGNINRIKAGYIIYLPASDEISSDDLADALSEVKQQNEDWRAGRVTASAASSGPGLRISAGPQEAEPAMDAARSSASAESAASAAAALEGLERSELENQELGDRLSALTEQIQTLENIVAVKDDQIRALQDALREQNSSSETPAGMRRGTDDGDANRADDAADAGDVAAEVSGTQPSEPAAAAPGTTPASRTEAPATAGSSNQLKTAPEPESSWMMTWMYAGIAVLLALLAGLFFWRRRNADDENSEPEQRDVFAGVELREQELQVDETPGEEPFEDSQAPAADLEPAVPLASGSSYGQRKHDEYAADVDSGDALAEADIYIAYGRYPQAIELLKTAVGAEPENPVYRLKLVELYAQVGQRENATEQLDKLRSLGDLSLVARGEDVLAELDREGSGVSAASAVESQPDFIVPTVGNPSGASGLEIPTTNSAEFETAPDFDEAELSAEDSFSDLEIESDFGHLGDLDEELDLSTDFENDIDDELQDDDDDELVFAAEGNQMSTKLDLARAYIDMGDEDGARQILDEVVLEGSPEQQREAQALLERFD